MKDIITSKLKLDLDYVFNQFRGMQDKSIFNPRYKRWTMYLENLNGRNYQFRSKKKLCILDILFV